MKDLSLLDLIDACDNARPCDPRTQVDFDAERLVPFYLSPSPTSPIVGLLRPVIVKKLSQENVDVWRVQPNKISFALDVNTPLKRSAAMKELCERWRDQELFANICGPKKWRAELYPIWKDPFGAPEYPSPGQEDSDAYNFAFEMERSACALFGVITYGVHSTFYERGDDGLKLWIPTRAKTKQTWVRPVAIFARYTDHCDTDGLGFWTTRLLAVSQVA